MTKLTKCTKAWRDVIGATAELDQIFDRIGPKYLPKDPFEFAQYSLATTKAVVLVSYPDPQWASGLAFSSADGPTMASRGFFAQLERLELVRAGHGYALKHLAAQGIVLLNCALTTEVNKPGSHTHLWRAWMDEFITRLSRALPATTWMLWGTDVQQREPNILAGRADHEILRAPHPSQPEFEQCDHIKRLAMRHPAIVWDARDVETHFYTDGAAKNNQRNSCRAAWGVVCTRGLMLDRHWSGELTAKLIEGPVPKATPKFGETRKYKLIRPGIAEVEARPTNIRAEAEALIRAMRLALSLPQHVIVIHTDSKCWMEMLERHIPNWINNESPWNRHANADLCEAIWIMGQAAKSHGVQLKFINAWHDRDRPVDKHDLAWWLGNQAAEREAESALR